ncbi:M56 family metallopeptidase [Pedobacter deserti]|uniref:M56 family metallopeptidase n=1 Tax=Pedobacter deserti TaxID=2817382 RepID=UPI00210D5948|nr:M56 family metallopeptidase [Pedobacter sp. SYSU D00382]
MTWAHYLLQVNIYLVVFYGFYKLLLDKETYFTLNRIYLLSAGVFSVIIPFLRIEWFVSQPAVQPVYTGAVQINDYLAQVSLAEAQPQSFGLGQWLVLIYFTGVAFMIIRLAVRLLSVKELLSRPSDGNAFSFFRTKLVDPALPGLSTINRHEEVHIRQWHTADLIFFELVSAFLWFNPVIYLYKKAAQNIHEYLADEAAAKFQGDKEQYALLLLSNAFKIPQSELVNSFFNKSLIKKRIFMLHKERSRKIGLIKYGLFLPLFAIALVMSSATIRRSKQIKAIADEIPAEQPIAVAKRVVAAVERQAPNLKAAQQLVRVEETKQTNQDIFKEFYTYMMKAMRYPPLAAQQGKAGTRIINFTITDGELFDITKTSETPSLGMDEEIIRVMKRYDDYTKLPNGKFSLPVEFILADSSKEIKGSDTDSQIIPGYTRLSKIVIRGYTKQKINTTVAEPPSDVSIQSSSTTNTEGGKVYEFTTIDRQPTFPGGIKEFFAFIQRTVQYPQEALQHNVHGKVYVSFIVETDGQLANIKIERKLGYGTDEEAVRLIKSSPNWEPGTKDGKPVRVKFNLPIAFNLAKEDNN